MTEAAALLAAVAAQPADDNPRLIYADWLDDHGEPERAEFIRVQVELAQADSGDRCYACDWPYTPGQGCERGNCAFRPSKHNQEYPRWKQRHTHYHVLRRRERELFDSHYREWTAVIKPSAELTPAHATITYVQLHNDVDDPNWIGCTFRRGFVAEARVPKMAALVGGECGRCDGSGFVGCIVQHRHMGRAGGVYHGCRHHTDPHQSHHHHDNTCTQCPDCRGTGPTPGIAAELGRHPVERVWVGDREPYLQDIWSRGMVASSIHPHADLPVDIFDLLKGSIGSYRNRYHGRQYLEFTDRAAALDALAVACAEWCRREAVKPRTHVASLEAQEVVENGRTVTIATESAPQDR